jgi:hypothetical protein
MAQYWLKASADAQADGPLAAAEVKRRAAAGEISRATLISMDSATWHPAGRVKGLFTAAATPAPARETVPPSAAWDQPAYANDNGAAAAHATPPPEPTASPPPSPRPARRPVPPAYPGTVRRVVESAPVAPSADVSVPPPATPPPTPMAEIGTGTIESQLPIPLPPLTQPAAAPPPLTQPAAAPPPPPLPAARAPLSYATPGGTGSGHLRPRKTAAFLVVAIVMIPVGLFHAYEWYVGFARRGDGMHDLLRVLVCAVWTGLAIAALALWMKWLTGAHKDIGVVTGYRYSISPAKATGLSFIPLFDAFWAVFMPAKLAGAVNAALEAAGLPKVSRGAVTACQVVSVIAPFVGLYALTPLLYAMSMRIIQGGLNRLAANQYAT